MRILPSTRQTVPLSNAGNNSPSPGGEGAGEGERAFPSSNQFLNQRSTSPQSANTTEARPTSAVLSSNAGNDSPSPGGEGERSFSSSNQSLNPRSHSPQSANATGAQPTQAVLSSNAGNNSPSLGGEGRGEGERAFPSSNQFLNQHSTSSQLANTTEARPTQTLPSPNAGNISSSPGGEGRGERSPKLKLRSQAAFTMVEIAICLAVIGFALVAIIGVLPIGMNVQKENREETIINFDANYLMSAITSGSFGQDELTNYVIAITNVMTIYNQNRVATNIRTNWYTTVGPTYSSVAAFANRSFLTNGFNIIGLLTIPKYAGYPGGGFVSNYVTADFRATTGSPMDQGNGQASKDFAFSYRVYPEIIPEPSLLNYVNASSGFNAGDPINSNYIVLATNLQANLSEIRLRFRWPVLPGGRLGNGNQVFRTAASGLVGQTSQGLHFILPQSYGINSSPYLLP